MNEWHNWFRKEVEILGFLDAYKRLKSFVKFHNYFDNTKWWESGSFIKYRDDEPDGCNQMIDSCIIANYAIKSMMDSGKERTTEQQ